MSHIASILPKNLKLSSIDEAQLLRRRASLADSLELTRRVAKDLESQRNSFDILEAAGIVVILTGLVSDIILDTVGQTVGKRFPGAKQLFDHVYGRVKEDQWRGNPYEKEIGLIKDNAAHLEALAEAERSGMAKMAITVHKNMLMNALGLVGYLQGSKDSRQVIVKAIKSLQANIQVLEEQYRNTEFYLKTGAGPAPTQRFTPAGSATPGLH